MRKKITLLTLILASQFINSQVGINTTTPESTLDVRAVNHNGAVTSLDGLLVPKVNDLTTNGSSDGQLIYLINDVSTFKKGFHYWNSTLSVWHPLDFSNIYSVDGVLPTNRDVSLGGNNLTFNGLGEVGIGNLANKYAKLDINSTNQGILLPRIALPTRFHDLNADNNNNIADQPKGLLAYNTGSGGLSYEGFVFWSGTEWRKLDNSEIINPTVSSLQCNEAKLDPPTYMAGQSYSGILKIPYAGGNGAAFSSISPIASTGVTGLTATLQPGALALGSGILYFYVSGTPSASSPALATFTIPSLFGASSCAAIVGDNPFAIGETRSFSASVSMSTFSSTGPTRTKMDGKNIGDTQSITKRLLIETAGLTNTSPGVVIINGLRMDFKNNNSSEVDPVFVNTKGTSVQYTISSLSTYDRYVYGAKTTIAPYAISYTIDGDANFWCHNNDRAEYVNSMLTFPSGQWYNLTFHAKQVDGVVTGYWTATRYQ
ncbi:hypothetical protein [Flavobacterium sp.]|uniref:hypothetical protein n=1 Tax=Flavobacterium sp. TaxID=239 RepID=UPI0040480967